MDPYVFQFIGNTVENAMNAFVQPAATSLMFALQMLVLTGVTLYITLTGYAISTGAVQSPFWTFVKQCVKIILIAFFALTVEGYINGVMGAIGGLETGLAKAINGQAGNATTIYQVLDQSLGRGFELVAQCFEMADKAGWSIGSALAWVIAGIVVALGTVLVSLLGGAVIIVAKFSLAIMFALGPLFIVCLMFPATARFFDLWFSQVMNYVLTIVIIATIMSFAMKAFDAFIAEAQFSTYSDQNPMFSALQIGTLSGILCWIICKRITWLRAWLGGSPWRPWAFGISCHLFLAVWASLRALGTSSTRCPYVATCNPA